MDTKEKGVRETIAKILLPVMLCTTGFAIGASVQHQHYILGGKPVIPEPEVRIVYKAADESHKATDSIAAMVLKLQPKLEPVVVKAISEAVSKYSVKFALPPELVLAVINRESRFKVLVTSHKNAVGLMQVIPKWHADKIKKLGLKRNEVYHIDHNIHLGCWIINEYYGKTKAIDKALFKYLGGTNGEYVKDILSCLTTLLIEDKIAQKEAKDAIVSDSKIGQPDSNS